MTDHPTLTIRCGAHRIELEPDTTLTFGRTPDDAAPPPDPDGEGLPHLGLSSNSRLHALAGRIDVDNLGWLLTNTGRWLYLRVSEHGEPNRVELQPGRTVRIPYAHCRVEITTGDETVGFDAHCPWLGRAAGDEPAAIPLAGSTVEALGLNRNAGYFRALVALCAPRLRDPHSDEIATEGEIARVLNHLPEERERVTVKAVERRLAHVRHKVGLANIDPYGGSAAGLEVRDAARQLADLAMRTGAVSRRDLDLIEAGNRPEPSGDHSTPGPRR